METARRFTATENGRSWQPPCNVIPETDDAR
jgi:hypothetical protein